MHSYKSCEYKIRIAAKYTIISLKCTYLKIKGFKYYQKRV